jgi:hypothetical protein
VDERDHGGADDRGVQQEGGLAKCQRLPDDGRHHRQVHGVADMPVEPADDQALGWRDRCGVPVEVWRQRRAARLPG